MWSRFTRVRAAKGASPILRRNKLRYARTFPPGEERNQHFHVAVSLRALFKNEKWLRDHLRNDVAAQ
jgi:hypothetical protein